MAKLKTLSGPLGSPTFELTGPHITIGRARDNAVALIHRSVSKHHAVLIFEDDQPKLFDLHSTNGTFVNGQQITVAPLHHDDQIVMGEFVFSYESDAPVTPAETPAPAASAPVAVAPARVAPAEPPPQKISGDVLKKLAVSGPRVTTGPIGLRRDAATPPPAATVPPAAPPPEPTAPAPERAFIRVPSAKPAQPVAKPGLMSKFLKKDSAPVPAVEKIAALPAAPAEEKVLQRPPAAAENDAALSVKKPSGEGKDRILVRPGAAPAERIIKRPGGLKPE